MTFAKPYILILIIVFFGVQSCTKNNVAKPAKAILIAPAQNSICLTGNILSTTQSAVTFNWQVAANTDSYTINIKNLISGVVIQQQVNTRSAVITLNRGLPYSWYVSSNNNGASVESDTWKFYNSGVGISSYAPFPADLTSPTFGQSVTGSTVTLTWTGNDPDNDITSFDIYFGTTTTPALLKAVQTAQSLSGVTIASGKTYYWQIVTHDSQGNASSSDIYQFSVK